MKQACLFKVLQRQLKFRNPKHLLKLPDDFSFTGSEANAAENYLARLIEKEIFFTYPGHRYYPAAFYKMKEPPLFLEYRGQPFWNNTKFIAIVGSRQMSNLTEGWLCKHIPNFIREAQIGIVSGGAMGVDQLAHSLAIKSQCPTLFVLPSGLEKIYPFSLNKYVDGPYNALICMMSEFELDHQIHKSHFYFRNRLIAALGEMTLVAQATLKSGSLLTVHHCLEFGRPVLTIPSHPEIIGFEGNLKLVNDGAYSVAHSQQLLDFWKAESWSSLPI
ncbi:MAG: DNA-processing protein DprA [Bdellovibrionaceae bacterium]|nr:DNA-processing protein DprA [Bdellovibrio sp.]